MPMKPRTFRRVVLLGSLGAIAMVLAFGYFVFRPWQNQRQLEAMRVDGERAFEEGDFLNATKLLGRYNKSVEQPEADLLLQFARARAKLQADDGGHILVSINAYREYLRRVPGDTEAAMELLPLMNTWGMYIEARSLGEDLMNEQGITDIEVVRELRYALGGLQARDEEIEPVMRAAYEHEDSGFTDANIYFQHLNSNARTDEVDRLLADRLEQSPESIEVRLLSLQRRAINMSNDEVQSELDEIVGRDAQTGEIADDAPTLSAETAWFVSRMYNALGMHPESIRVQARSANSNGDYLSVAWAARRMYWANDDGGLGNLRVTTEDGEPDADVLGYQYLAALRRADEQAQQELVEQLDSIVLDRRMRAWKNFIEGETAFRENKLVDARVAVQKALDVYASEPTFRLLMGDVHNAQGRMNEAIEEWLIANELANDRMGNDLRFTLMGWPTPMIRIVNSFSAQSRLVEAIDYIQELERVGMNDSKAAVTVLQAKATLARSSEMPMDMGVRFVRNWNENKESIEPQARAMIAPMVATVLAMMDERDTAREELELALSVARAQPSLMVDLIDVDARYALGVAEGAGIDLDSVGAQTPTGALRIANRIAEEQGSIDAGLRVIDEGMASAPVEERGIWARIRVQFLDARDDRRAAAGWDALIETSPDDLDLLYLAAESNAFDNDLEKIDSLIERITELTSTAGKTTPSRLRLARANAMVGVVRNRTNRESALEIVRSVVASETENIKARNMLGRLLALPPTPGLPEDERYTPDIQSAIDQYVTLARQLNNRGAQSYMLEASDLAFRMGDEEQTVSLLREFTTRFDEDWVTLPFAAERYENLGRLQEAADIYQRVLSETGQPDAALAYADLLLKLGQTGAGKQLLQQISEQDSLTQDQVLRLAGLLTRSGNRPEGELIASDGQRFGLSSSDSKLLFARYARTHLSPEQQISALREATVLDETNTTAWKELVKRLIELGRFEEASAAYDRAVTLVETDDTLERLGVLSRGTPQSAQEMLRMPGVEDSPQMRQAILQVDQYNTLPQDATLEQRVNMLNALIEEFPGIGAVQSYAVVQLSVLPLNPMLTASLADRALKNSKDNAVIMGIAAESYLNANQPEESIRVVELWRANSLESSVLAEAITGRALIQIEDYQQAADLLSPYIDDAVNEPELALNREILDAFCFARLKIGEDPSVTAARLEPLISESQEIRNRIWLGLAANAIEDHNVGASWIEQAQQHADLEDDTDRLAQASAWVQLVEKHEAWDTDYAQRAIGLLEPLEALGDEANPQALRAMGIAHAALARAGRGSDLGSDDFASAVDYMLRAADRDQGNLAPLLDAARYALEGDMQERAKEIYERLLGYAIPDGPLRAMVLNNLSMSSLRVGFDEQSSVIVLGYVKELTAMAPSVATYWGTRGWVELQVGDSGAAEGSFQTMLGIEPQSAEGWTGLAIALHAQGQDRAQEALDALERVRSIDAAEPLEAELRQMLSKHGLQDWASVQVP